MTLFTLDQLRMGGARLLSRITGKPVITRRNVLVDEPFQDAPGRVLNMSSYREAIVENPQSRKPIGTYVARTGGEYDLMEKRRVHRKLRVRLIERNTGRVFHMEDETFRQLFVPKEQ